MYSHSSSVLRRLLLIGVLVSAFAAGLPGDAQSAARSGIEPPAGTVTLEWQGLLESESEHDVNDLSEIALHYGVSESEALQRIRVENRAPALQLQAQSQWPATFAGLWIDTDVAEPYVYVAFSGNSISTASLNVELLKPFFSDPDLLVPVTTFYPLKQLEAIQAAMIADRAIAQAGDPAHVLSPAITATGGRYDVDIDIETNSVVVVLETQEQADDPAIQSAFNAYSTGPFIDITTGISEPKSCTRADCRYSMRGGLQLTDLIYGYCSSAFSATAGIQSFVLSASHCPNGPRSNGEIIYGSADAIYGSADLEQMQGTVDAERLRRDNVIWGNEGVVWVEGDDQRSVKYHMAWADMVKGTRVLKSGYRTGTTRGDVISKYYSPSYVPESRRFVKAGLCADNGDSGGAVMRGNTAWGIVSGGPVDSCAYTIFGAIDYAMKSTGVNLLAGP